MMKSARTHPKVILLVFAIILMFVNVNKLTAQTVVHPSVIKKPIAFAISGPLRNNTVVSYSDFEPREMPINRKVKSAMLQPNFSGMLTDPGKQENIGSVMSAGIKNNYAGQNSNLYPPDANGDVNDTYYFQVVNLTYAIYRKSDGSVVAGPSALNSIFNSKLPGASCNDGDPIVLWDEHAQKWFYAEFSLCGSNDYMLIAVSTTSDPAGTWYSWSFDVDDMPDYPKFGIWQDGYYMAVNNPSGKDVYVFDRNAMIAGHSDATMIGFDNPNRPSTFDGFHCVLPLDNDGPWAPAGTPGQFITVADDGQGNPSDALYIYELHVDWSTPSNSTFSRTQTLVVNSFSGNFNSSWNNIPQPGTSQKLDAISTVLMHRAQYRNFNGIQKIVCNHTIAVSSTQAAIRWYELDNTGSGWFIAQQGTYNPDSKSRWCASIAINDLGEIAMGYSVSDGSSTFPSIRYCGQTNFASANTMDIAETSIWSGNYSQTNYNRWGDYSNISLDPSDGHTFWFTSEYVGSSTHGTRIASFLITESVSGTISRNTCWSGVINISGNVIINNGVTLTISPGSILYFGSGASLIVNGNLVAIGTSSQPITFARSGTSGNWGSIVLNGSGANGSTITYANINYGTEVDVTSANNITIQNCNITNSSGNGIYVYSSSNFLAQSNTITNNNSYCGISIIGGSSNNCYGNVIYRPNHVQQGIGILYNSCGGSVARNDIAWCGAGIEVINGSSPTSWMGSNPPDNRNNRVTNCGVGLYVYNQSHPCFGVIADGRYSYNSIVRYSNGMYNADVENSSSLVAEQDWWGSAPPPSTFYVGGGCSLDYSYWLTIDPWYGFPLHFIVPAPGPSKDGGKLLASVNTTGSEIIAPNSSNAAVEPSNLESLLAGIELRDDNKQKEAKDFFRSYLDTHPDNQAAYVYLYSCANSETTPELIQYFNSLPKQAAKEHKLLLSYLYLMQGDVKSAKQVNTGIIDANPNTRLAVRAKLNNFYITLYNENDPILASSILSEVMSSKDLSTPTELGLAQNALRTYVDPNTGKMPNSSIGQGSDGSVTVGPVQEGLMMNYPNPFNPSTTISYKLSSAGHVTLKVYDILGREVITLVDEYQEGGVHTAHLDGQNLASGVYFYRLTAPGLSQLKKMVMIK